MGDTKNHESQTACEWCGNKDAKLMVNDVRRIYGEKTGQWIDVDYGVICKACGKNQRISIT